MPPHPRTSVPWVGFGQQSFTNYEKVRDHATVASVHHHVTTGTLTFESSKPNHLSITHNSLDINTQ
ncbi:uncharacterized protein QC763_0081080 [Podospora pseudopauciseta]|uniref:Uncharacterized protein n=2 Tax=Podospora TaxID=5144 RepID=A0ABR0H7J5_9PEZI|nr:hypothetical protein QC763_0081080 [Podospora pseudopauciseta]KAK4675117.1 hypothetical protein QC764_0074640 [Podospora pseudoanserina]